ncbi:DUF4381 domain-containing protein [Bosea sp. LjRoot237]|uniref:DUF4381 domain-containing protein n=1 Tax=Bosea sp. LjRoot237 TaxID=3342292 RepID=UPI003ECDFF8F
MSDPGDLNRLADLALPPPVPFWPPAAGVWIVGCAALAALSVLGWRSWSRYRADAYLRAAAAELDALAAGPAAAEAISAVLKRAAFVAHGRERVASLTGQAWGAFLAETAPGSLRIDALTAMIAGAPAATPPPEQAVSGEIIAQAKSWLHGQRGRLPAEA